MLNLPRATEKARGEEKALSLSIAYSKTACHGDNRGLRTLARTSAWPAVGFSFRFSLAVDSVLCVSA